MRKRVIACSILAGSCAVVAYVLHKDHKMQEKSKAIKAALNNRIVFDHKSNELKPDNGRASRNEDDNIALAFEAGTVKPWDLDDEAYFGIIKEFLGILWIKLSDKNCHMVSVISKSGDSASFKIQGVEEILTVKLILLDDNIYTFYLSEDEFDYATVTATRDSVVDVQVL